MASCISYRHWHPAGFIVRPPYRNRELYVERSSIIQGASQDLSTDDRNIASLDKGEAIISSNFTKFAVPIKIPLFEDIVKDLEITSSKKQKKVNVIT